MTAALQIFLGISYPVLIYFALSRWEPRMVAICVLGLLGLRVGIASRAKLAAHTRAFWLPVATIGAVAGISATWNHPLSLLLTPTFINLALLGSFGLSLSQEQSMIERFALLQVDSLSSQERVYCRQVTKIWCGFFVFNSALSLALALGAETRIWALYTGLVSYVLIGTLFALEFIYRHWRFRRYVGAPTDPLMRWLFPPLPEPTAQLGDAIVPEAEVHDSASIHDPARTGQQSLREHQTHPAENQPRPVYTAERLDERHREFDLVVPKDLSCWPGHFPELSILPGVVQIDWVMGEIGRWLEAEPQLAGFESLKFKRPVYPGQELTLELEGDEPLCRFHFRLVHQDEVFASGRVVLQTPQTRPGGEAS